MWTASMPDVPVIGYTVIFKATCVHHPWQSDGCRKVSSSPKCDKSSLNSGSFRAVVAESSSANPYVDMLLFYNIFLVVQFKLFFFFQPLSRGLFWRRYLDLQNPIIFLRLVTTKWIGISNSSWIAGRLAASNDCSVANKWRQCTWVWMRSMHGTLSKWLRSMLSMIGIKSSLFHTQCEISLEAKGWPFAVCTNPLRPPSEILPFTVSSLHHSLATPARFAIAILKENTLSKSQPFTWALAIYMNSPLLPATLSALQDC